MPSESTISIQVIVENNVRKTSLDQAEGPSKKHPISHSEQTDAEGKHPSMEVMEVSFQGGKTDCYNILKTH